MGQIQEVLEKLRTGTYTKSTREDLIKTGNSMIFSEESRRIIHELDNLELYELRQKSSTIQCHSCWKHMHEETLIVLHYVARINRSTNKKCGESQWRRDHWKAKDATRAAIKNGKDTITIRWQQDEQYRESQMAHGWTGEYCKHLIYPKTIDVDYMATWDKHTDTKVLLHTP